MDLLLLTQALPLMYSTLVKWNSAMSCFICICVCVSICICICVCRTNNPFPPLIYSSLGKWNRAVSYSGSKSWQHFEICFGSISIAQQGKLKLLLSPTMISQTFHISYFTLSPTDLIFGCPWSVRNDQMYG